MIEYKEDSDAIVAMHNTNASLKCLLKVSVHSPWTGLAGWARD